MSDTLKLLAQQEIHSIHLEVLLELNYFDRCYFAADTKSMAAVRSNVMLLLHTPNAWDDVIINTVDTTIVSDGI